MSFFALMLREGTPDAENSHEQRWREMAQGAPGILSPDLILPEGIAPPPVFSAAGPAMVLGERLVQAMLAAGADLITARAKLNGRPGWRLVQPRERIYGVLEAGQLADPDWEPPVPVFALGGSPELWVIWVSAAMAEALIAAEPAVAAHLFTAAQALERAGTVVPMRFGDAPPTPAAPDIVTARSDAEARTAILAAARQHGPIGLTGNRESWSQLVWQGGDWWLHFGDHGGAPMQSRLSEDQALARLRERYAPGAGLIALWDAMQALRF